MTPELMVLKETVIRGMADYMTIENENDPNHDPDFEAGYQQQHIDQCSGILNHFLTAMDAVRGPTPNDDILKIVKGTLLELNSLNATCEGSLIETDQREELCSLINSAAEHAGFSAHIDDITEQWREW